LTRLLAPTLPNPVLQTLGDNKILSVPVLDDEGEYLGAFSVGDVLRVLMQGECCSLAGPAVLHGLGLVLLS
jgi:CBS domain-containing protein